MNTKDIIIWVCAIVAFVAGIGLTIFGCITPPVGEISGSVLTALGELLTFTASIFGIGKYTSIQIARVRRSARVIDNDEDIE